MAAWKHSNRKGWSADVYYDYRKFVASKAESYRGREEDCADLSMTLLIDFAAENGLMLTFQDNADGIYMSKAPAAIKGHAGRHKFDSDLTWTTKEQFASMILRKIGVEALWKRGTIVSEYGPLPGDLMIIWNNKGRHHTGLVYRTFHPGTPHPKWNDKNVPNFPGSDAAFQQQNQTEYFRGTTDSKGKTINRYEVAWRDVHFDFLNHRGEDKPKAELIYFANSRQMREEGFEFRMYAKRVVDNWFDWDGTGMPPFGTHDYP